MNSKTFKIIYSLLVVLLVSVFLVQAYWLRHFYLQKKYEFERNVYSVLADLGQKLEARRRLAAVKMTYIIVGNDTVVKTPSRNMEIKTESATAIVNKNKTHVLTREVIKSSKLEKAIDSIFIDGIGQNINIKLQKAEKGRTRVFVNKNGKDIIERGLPFEDPDSIEKLIRGEQEETRKLLDKMITEIKVMDTETENNDSLRSLIGQELRNRGIFLPFEFLLERNKNKRVETRSQSSGFDSSLFSYRSDISLNKLIGPKEFLLLQFPGKNDFVLGGMRDSLLLSLAFTLVMLFIFYYIIKLIAGQKKLSEIRNDFVNNMTHELKTPIATISLAVDAINNPAIKQNEEKFNEYTRILREENQKLNDHVERVLQLSLLEKGDLRLAERPVDLVALVESSIRSFGLLIKEKNVRVNFIAESKPLLVKGDAGHLLAAVSNLLDNAIKYGGEHPEITITLKCVNGTVFLNVTDNGIGIEKAKQEKVFEKFYRVQGGELHDVKGFGLGLSYVRSIIEAHGGQLVLNSELNQGSEFIISLAAYD